MNRFTKESLVLMACCFALIIGVSEYEVEPFSSEIQVENEMKIRGYQIATISRSLTINDCDTKDDSWEIITTKDNNTTTEVCTNNGWYGWGASSTIMNIP